MFDSQWPEQSRQLLANEETEVHKVTFLRYTALLESWAPDFLLNSLSGAAFCPSYCHRLLPRFPPLCPASWSYLRAGACIQAFQIPRGKQHWLTIILITSSLSYVFIVFIETYWILMMISFSNEWDYLKFSSSKNKKYLLNHIHVQVTNSVLFNFDPQNLEKWGSYYSSFRGQKTQPMTLVLCPWALRGKQFRMKWS